MLVQVKELTSLGDDWIDLLKSQSADWVGKPLVVLSLFDGIGAIWTALSLIGIPFVGYSSEIVSSICIFLKAYICK